MSEFPIIRYASSPSSQPYGVGGDANTIWLCDPNTDRIYELSTTDFSVIRSALSPWLPYGLGRAPEGIGGDANTIWFCDTQWTVFELSTTDFSVIRSALKWPGYGYPRGIGGDANTIWSCDSGNKYYELSTTDLSTIRSASSPSRPEGIGGDANTIWSSHSGGAIYELSTIDFSAIRYDSLGGHPYGIGGDADVIWCTIVGCGPYGCQMIYELSTRPCGKVEVGDEVILLPIGNMFGNVVALKSFIFREGYSQKAFLPSLDEKVALKLAFRSCRAKTNDKVICLPIEGMKENIVALR